MHMNAKRISLDTGAKFGWESNTFACNQVRIMHDWVIQGCSHTFLIWESPAVPFRLLLRD
jgi:hypothetical protein